MKQNLKNLRSIRRLSESSHESRDRNLKRVHKKNVKKVINRKNVNKLDAQKQLTDSKLNKNKTRINSRRPLNLHSKFVKRPDEDILRKITSTLSNDSDFEETASQMAKNCSFNPSFKFKNLINIQIHQLIDWISLGFTFYLSNKNFNHLYVKHFVYLTHGRVFDYELFLVLIYGLIKSFILMYLFMSKINFISTNRPKVAEKKQTLLNLICFGSELASAILFGSIQLANHMSVWDFKRKFSNNVAFKLELFKYFFEIFFLVLILTFNLIKYIKF